MPRKKLSSEEKKRRKKDRDDKRNRRKSEVLSESDKRARKRERDNLYYENLTPEKKETKKEQMRRVSTRRRKTPQKFDDFETDRLYTNFYQQQEDDCQAPDDDDMPALAPRVLDYQEEDDDTSHENQVPNIAQNDATTTAEQIAEDNNVEATTTTQDLDEVSSEENSEEYLAESQLLADEFDPPIEQPPQVPTSQDIPIGRRCNMDTFSPRGISYYSAGSCSTECFYCHALGYKEENKGSGIKPHFGRLCCNKGKVKLTGFPQLPPTLNRLFQGNDDDSKYFLKHIRKFNAGMAMASVQVNEATVQRGPASFKVWGQMHRRIGSMIQAPGSTQPNCVQVYFHDAEYQAKHRAARNANPNMSARLYQLEVSIYRMIHHAVTSECNNSYLRSFLTVNEYIQQNSLDPEELQIELHATDRPPPGQHPGRYNYNLPTAPEIALLMPTSLPRNSQRSVVCNVRQSGRENRLQFFQDYHRSYPPLVYVVFFPHGTDGWNTELRSQHAPFAKVTLAAYVRYHIMQRDFFYEDYFLLHGRKLFQQYVTDEWAREELRRLKWLEYHQQTIRADLYSGVVDSTRANDVANSGQQVILPASFTQSDRWYHKSYKNAMSIVRALGKPTLFITMTMDVNCPEVRAQLKPGETPYDRPELLCRLFEIKKKKLLSMIVKDGIFGKCIAHVAVVEFQKRGAPHSHILIWIENFQMTPHNIDNIISAEIPPRGEEGTPERAFHDLVIEKMIHGPCGRNYNRNFACNRESSDGTCKRNFPRAYKSTTETGEGCFPDYRRRSPAEGGYTGSKWINGAEVEIDNSWVVPYNPLLLAKFKCHINVEFCHTVTSVKYLFLYHFKGEDLVTTENLNESNEIEMYHQRRYISAVHACFRLFEFNIIQMEPSVKQLPLHLPNEQVVTYHPDESGARDALASNAVTMLTGYFHANSDPIHGEMARTLKYEDFVHKFVWKAETKRWTPRQVIDDTPKTIGRMVSIHPNSGDLFYMRLLLKHRAGCRSYEDLRRVEGVLKPDFKSACIALELCEDDSQWIDCLNEAVEVATPVSIRDLFCNIVLNCHPTDPPSIMIQFQDAMSEDFVRRRGANPSNLSDEQIQELIHNDLLIALNKNFEVHGKSNASFGIDMPNDSLDLQTIDAELEAETDDDAERYYNENYPLLNAEQKIIFHQIMGHIDNNEGGLYRFDAPGGSGKTFLANLILAYVRKQNHIAIATALSGIAATLLKLGTTFHRRFGAPIPDFKDSCSKIKFNSKEAILIKHSYLIMIDEVSMMKANLLDMLDRFLRALMGKDEYMGGKLIVLMHDFRQILPVIPGGGRADITAASVIQSDAWDKFTALQLTKNMRVERHIQQMQCPAKIERLKWYAQWILSIGNGTVETVPGTTDVIEVPPEMVCKSKDELESRVYDNFLQNYDDPGYLSKRAIMSCTNDTIQECNYQMIKRLPGEMIESYSIDSCVEDNDQSLYDAEFLNRINASGIAPHKLALKVGACIILIKNLNLRDGHCNGTRYIITNLTKHLICARRLNGGPNPDILIPRIPMISKDTDFPVPFKRLQFPVLGAYYLTLNRAQGQSLAKAGMYLPRSVFSHGHLYVGFSRCGDFDGNFVYADQSEFDNIRHLLEDGKIYTRNVVYPEMLR